jgi:hypothetical protein
MIIMYGSTLAGVFGFVAHYPLFEAGIPENPRHRITLLRFLFHLALLIF